MIAIIMPGKMPSTYERPRYAFIADISTAAVV